MRVGACSTSVTNCSTDGSISWIWNVSRTASGVFSPSPAIANALYDAVGVIVSDLPLTPERVLRAIREAENRPLGDE